MSERASGSGVRCSGEAGDPIGMAAQLAKALQKLAMSTTQAWAEVGVAVDSAGDASKFGSLHETVG